MTAEIQWSDLVRCYDNIEFLSDMEGVLTVASNEIVKVVRSVENDEDLASDVNLYAMEQLPDSLQIGSRIKVHVGAPKLRFGILASNFQSLLDSPGAYTECPAHFYIRDSRLSDRDNDDEAIQRYRVVVALVKLLSEAATFVDRKDQTLYFFKDGKIELPVRFTSDALRSVDTAHANRLLRQFNNDPLHRSQKLAILAESAAELSKSQPRAARFAYILNNVDQLSANVDDGYRLFVSSFSYKKIRSELEVASLDFVSKIHKTFVDIQGQLLGIPVATIVVASQLKAASGCGVEYWTNIAVLAGAWIFVVFLGASIMNQVLTLNAINREIAGQRTKLEGDFAAISTKFLDIFDALGSRIFWYRLLYVIVGGIGLAGGVFATYAFRALTKVSIVSCW